MLLTVRARRRFEYEGREVTAGEAMLVTPIEAAALHRRQLVSLTRELRPQRREVLTQTVAATPEPAAIATPAATAVEAQPAEPTPKPRRRAKKDPTAATRPRRTYQRRDFVPEP